MEDSSYWAAGQRGARRLPGHQQLRLGEPGGNTALACSGATLAVALGGGKRPDVTTAPKSSKGGIGGVVMNTLNSTGDLQVKQRSTAIQLGGDGQDGRGGYGSGGAGGGAGGGTGGGASVTLNGTSVRPDGTVVNRSTVRNAPVGKAGYGAGSGGGPNEYRSTAVSYPAANAAQYGAGGGGGAARWGTQTSSAREGGNGDSR